MSAKWLIDSLIIHYIHNTALYNESAHQCKYIRALRNTPKMYVKFTDKQKR